MQNLTGLVLATAKRSHEDVVAEIRIALADRITTESDHRIHIGEPVAGFTLVTDSSIVTFDHDAAVAIAGDTPAALFAVRDYGYRKGKRVARGSLVAFNAWKRMPKRPTNAEDVWRAIAGAADKNPFESKLWPPSHAVETRPGTTLCLTPATKTFPPRDTATNQALARTQRLESMIAGVRPHPLEQGPDDGPCMTLEAWRPVHLPEDADAILACVADKTLRMKQWTSLAHEIWSGNLILDIATARTLEPLRLKHSTAPTEQAVSYLSALLLDVELSTLSEAAQLETAVIAHRYGLLDRLAFDVTKMARATLAAREVSRAAHAARLLGTLTPDDLDAIGARAKSDRAFAIQLGVHGVVPDPPDSAGLLRVLDQVQPYVAVDEDDTDGYTHAHTLWLSWFRLRARPQDIDARDRIVRRIDLALELAPAHRATLQNAHVLATEIGDRERAARAKPATKRGRASRGR